jgi:membrane-associated protein
MLDPESLINFFGNASLLAVLAIVFIETGLLVGFFLPGDSLLIVTGVMVAGGIIDYPLWLVLILIFIAAAAGDQTGFLIGKKAGPKVFKRSEGILFHKDNALKAESFFNKYGGKSIILARFIPVMRTFIPVAAGVGNYEYKKFTQYNLIGAFLWGVGLTSVGFLFGGLPFVKEYLEYILIAIVVVSFIPVALELIKSRKS